MPYDLKVLHVAVGPALRQLQSQPHGTHMQRRQDAVVTAYDTAARKLDERWHDYPSPAEQRRRGLHGPVAQVLRGLPEVKGLIIGSFSESSDNVHKLAAEVADGWAARDWRLLGARSKTELRGKYITHVHRKWSCTFWREWARLIETRVMRVRDPTGELHGVVPRRARRSDFFVCRVSPDSGPSGPHGFGP